MEIVKNFLRKIKTNDKSNQADLNYLLNKIYPINNKGPRFDLIEISKLLDDNPNIEIANIFFDLFFPLNSREIETFLFLKEKIYNLMLSLFDKSDESLVYLYLANFLINYQFNYDNLSSWNLEIVKIMVRQFFVEFEKFNLPTESKIVNLSIKLFKILNISLLKKDFGFYFGQEIYFSPDFSIESMFSHEEVFDNLEVIVTDQISTFFNKFKEELRISIEDLKEELKNVPNTIQFFTNPSNMKYTNTDVAALLLTKEAIHNVTIGKKSEALLHFFKNSFDYNEPIKNLEQFDFTTEANKLVKFLNVWDLEKDDFYENLEPMDALKNIFEPSVETIPKSLDKEKPAGNPLFPFMSSI